MMLSKVAERLAVGAGEVETGITTFGAEFATTFCATGIAQAEVEAADPIYIDPNDTIPQSII